MLFTVLCVLLLYYVWSKELLVAGALMGGTENTLVCSVLVGRQHPKDHLQYPRMGRYPTRHSHIYQQAPTISLQEILFLKCVALF